MSPSIEPQYATLLVLVVTNTRVLLAADSRKNTLHPDGTTEAGTMDKIFRTGDCYYAVAGFSATADNSFSLQGVIHKTLSTYTGFAEAVQHLTTAVATELKTYFGALKKTSPTLFAQLLRDSHSGGEVVLVKRVEGIPTAVLLTYKITAGGEVKVVVERWSIDITTIKGGDDCFWRAIGHSPFHNSGTLPLKEVARHPASAAKRILQEGARAHPRFVSGPINMVELTAGGERWIEKTPTAPARVDE